MTQGLPRNLHQWMEMNRECLLMHGHSFKHFFTNAFIEMKQGIGVTGILAYIQTWCIHKKGPVFTAAFSPLLIVFSFLLETSNPWEEPPSWKVCQSLVFTPKPPYKAHYMSTSILFNLKQLEKNFLSNAKSFTV